MRISLLSLLLTACLAAFAVTGNAQEAQVPVDTLGKLQAITTELEQRLNMFPEYSNFKEAKLYQITDSSFVLEISYQPHEQLLKTRLMLNFSETKEFRQKVTERLTSASPTSLLDQEGRTKLLAGSLLLSLGYYGWALPVSMEIDNSQVGTAIYMITSAGGFFIPLLLTKNQSVPKGTATFSIYLATRGIAHGILLDLIAEGEDASGQGIVASGMVASLAEGIAGFAIAKQSNMSDGTACTIGVGGDFGLGLGGGAAFLADFSGDNQDRPIAACFLAGSAAGLFAGKLLADHQNYSRGDAYVLRASGILGMYVPCAILGIIKTESKDLVVGTAMGGLIVGSGLGHYLTRDKDFSANHGTVITLGEFTGGLLGLGLAFLVTPQDRDDATTYLSLSSIGAIGGFWGAYSLFAKEAKENTHKFSWDINFAPLVQKPISESRLFFPPSQKVVPAVTLKIEF